MTLHPSVTELFANAIRRRASDIHLRVRADGVEIAMRVYNALSIYDTLSRTDGISLCKEVYLASDGAGNDKAEFDIGARYNVRLVTETLTGSGLHAVWVSSSPDAAGMLMVLHLVYDDRDAPSSLSGLGFSVPHRRGFELMKARSGGMNILAGPKGAGKSTSIHRIVRDIVENRQGAAHVVSVEDPVEGLIPGVTQVLVRQTSNPKQRQAAYTESISVATKLDPDVLVIGQTSNPDSAELALRGVLRGRQVWSTVEANNALGIIDRLIQLGLDPKQILDPNIISGLVCQRLVGTLCQHCRVPLSDVMDRYPDAVIERMQELLGGAVAYITGPGCDGCHQTGMAGKTVVAEMVLPDWPLFELIRQGKKQDAYHYWRHQQEGETITQHCVQKISDGIVDPFHAELILGPLLLERYELSGNVVKPHDLKKIVHVAT